MVRRIKTINDSLFMRAEMIAVCDKIKESLQLLRRHL